MELTAYFIMRLSLMINLAYSTLWIMTGFLHNKIPENKAFMESVKTGSIYFLIGCIVSYLAGYSLKNFISRLKRIACVFHILFGIILIHCWYTFSATGLGACIILSCVQLALVNHFEAITQLQHLTARVMLMAEIAAFCLIPIFLTFCTGIKGSEIFVLLSGCACMVASGFLILI